MSTESIEQMKLIENGFFIDAVNLDVSIKGINEPPDLDEVNAYFFRMSNNKYAFARRLG